MTELLLTALGNPVPQGSIRSLGKGRPSVHANQNLLLPWRTHVQIEAQRALGDQTPFAGPVLAILLFTVPKPKSAPVRKMTWPVKRPDLDHLIRACLDALTAAGVWKDDSQVVRITAAKHYPNEGLGALYTPGVSIFVGSAE